VWFRLFFGDILHPDTNHSFSFFLFVSCAATKDLRRKCPRVYDFGFSPPSNWVCYSVPPLIDTKFVRFSTNPSPISLAKRTVATWKTYCLDFGKLIAVEVVESLQRWLRTFR
jgi:hypothetical protein